MWLGDSAGFELLHHVIELPFGSLAFLHDVEHGSPFARNPIYATLHESSYADGVATRWSSERLLPDEVRDEGYFTAEHVFPWMWEEYAELRPQRAAADILAEHEWPALFDPDQLGAQRGPGRGHDLQQRSVRGARLRGRDRRGDPRAAAVGDQRVRAQRSPRRR